MLGKYYLYRPRAIDASCHLRTAADWTQWIDDVRGAMSAEYWGCTLADPICPPSARVDIKFANDQVSSTLMRSIGPDIRRQIVNGYATKLAELLALMKTLVGSDTISDVPRRLQALLDVGPLPVGATAFAKQKATASKLYNALSGHASHNPRQNGVAERANRLITEGDRSMLHQSGLPHALWAEAMATCRAWKAATTETRSKLDPRGIPLVFVGYGLESKGYRLLDLNTRQVFKSRSVTFEGEFPARATGLRGPPAPVAGDDDSGVIVVSTTAEQPEDVVPAPIAPPAALRFDAPGPAWQSKEGPRDRNTPARSGAPASSRATPAAFAFSLGKERPHLVEGSNAPPQAEGWKAGAIEELQSMKDDYKVFSVVNITSVPKGSTILPSRHVFRTKRDKASKMVSLKTRIIARGCAQRKASKGHHIIQADVDKAYLHGILEEEIYTRVPPGIEGYDGKCLRLHRSIYGLKQAGRVWNDTINATLASIGYNRLSCGECIFRKADSLGDHYIALYIDDLLFFGPDLSEIDRFLDQLDTLYGIKRLSPAERVLGVQVVRHNVGGISLLQRQYLIDVLTRFGMSECNPCKSPMEANLQLLPEPNPDDDDNSTYRSMVGSLMYGVVATRPDLAHAVGYLSRFVGKAGPAHLEAAKRILRYIKGSLDLGIHYIRNDEPLLGYEG
ncbi:BQ2448_7003 [Microbotryum intermedium]|uniref:BQ2448_6999 protein n=1 Tax=Microbotryum intermedium TaxID=269621 RepID=A0A238FMH5_9BASI|nr:BQ2448_6999 [Microbotryum intermedium]SCV73078.1 BQ2448_7003 [Microbotryum intermedium]